MKPVTYIHAPSCQLMWPQAMATVALLVQLTLDTLVTES